MSLFLTVVANRFYIESFVSVDFPSREGLPRSKETEASVPSFLAKPLYSRAYCLNICFDTVALGKALVIIDFQSSFMCFLSDLATY